MAKPQSAVHIEENGVMYVTKRISANHKITIPMRKRKGNQLEKCKIEGISGENLISANENSNSTFSLLDAQGEIFRNAASTYSKHDEYVFDDSCHFSMPCINELTGSYVNTQNGCRLQKNTDYLSAQAATEHIYSQNREMNFLANSPQNNARFSESNNQYPPVMIDNLYPRNTNSYSQTKVLMPNYYYYNKQLMSQIVKQLQITIQNILQKNAGIYSCYETGHPNGWEIHNPKDGPIITIQFKQNKETKEDHMNTFPTDLEEFSCPGTSANNQDKMVYPVKKFRSFPVARKSTGGWQPKVKSCFVKINKLSDDELTPYRNEMEFDPNLPAKQEPSSDCDDYNDELINKCNKCNQTFKLRIQLAHHKCKIIIDETEDLSDGLNDSRNLENCNKMPTDKSSDEFLVPLCPSYVLSSQDEETTLSSETGTNEKVVPLSEIENIIMNPELTIYEMNDDESMSHLQQSLYCSKCVNCEKEVVGKDGEYCEKCEMEGSLNSNDQDEFIKPDQKINPIDDVEMQPKKPKVILQTNYQECPYCKKRFSPYYSLKYHTSKCDKNTHCFCKIINMNNKSEHVQCYLCAGKNEIEVMCRVCHKTFSNNNKLRRHMVIHSGVKRYVCSQCGKRFGRSDHLKLHKQTHSGTKPYMCSTCGKCFTTKQSVKFHMRLHSGVKPYSCNFCGKRFVQLAALKTHLQAHSSNKTYHKRPKS